MRAARHRDELIWHAWHTALLYRVEKFPKLSDVLKDNGKVSQPRRKRTWQEVGAEMQALALRAQNKGKG